MATRVPDGNRCAVAKAVAGRLAGGTGVNKTPNAVFAAIAPDISSLDRFAFAESIRCSHNRSHRRKRDSDMVTEMQKMIGHI